MNENRGHVPTDNGDWVERLSERVGFRRPAHQLPDWVVQDLRPTPESAETPPTMEAVEDIPPELQRRLREEAIQQTFHRLEMPLRLLLYATEANESPRSVQECHEIMRFWRQALERETGLAPDTAIGTVLPYQPALEGAYQVQGECEAGADMRVLVPAWRMDAEVIVRGQAEPLADTDAAGTTRRPTSPPAMTSPSPRQPRAPMRLSVMLALVLTLALGLFSLPSTAEVMCACLYGDPEPAAVMPLSPGSRPHPPVGIGETVSFTSFTPEATPELVSQTTATR